MEAGLDAEDIAEMLGLEPHPEGGHYLETWRADSTRGRPTGTAIYFLLREGEVSHWHRVDSAEIWHHYAGAALELSTWDEGEHIVTRRLGVDFRDGQRPQLIVAPGEWQSACTLGGWTLVGNTVSPGFEFAHFELAPSGWHPSGIPT